MGARRKAKGPSARGVALVERVIAAIEAGAPGELENPERRALTAAELDALSLPNGRAIPPSLRRWLAFDANALQELVTGEPPRLVVMTGRELARAYLTDAAAEALDADAGVFLPLRAGVGVFALYCGTPDAEGEYPVVHGHASDLIGAEVAVSHPGFDVFLAWVASLVDDPEEAYAEELAQARARNPFVTEDEVLGLVE